MFKYRLPSAICLIALLTLTVWGANRPGLEYLLPLLALGLTFLGTREMLACCAPHKPAAGWTYFCALMLVAVGYLFLSRPANTKLACLFTSLGLGVLLGTFLLPVARCKTEGALASVASTFLTLIYVPVLMLFILATALYGRRCAAIDGRFFLVWGVAMVKGADIGAYCVGTLFARSPLGNHKFVPFISPKKSIEGVIGGALLSVALGVLGALYLPSVSEACLRLGGRLLPCQETGRILGAAVISLILGLLGVLGDLVESVWKRDAGIKDSGSYIPGMGGMLDVLDSLLLTAPFLYAFTAILSRV